MNEPAAKVSAFRFEDYYLDGVNRQLWLQDRPVALNSKYFDVLFLLVSNNGQLVEKQRIFDEIWRGVFVTDAALTQCIKDIRRQLEDDASNPRYIKTVPKHGYIFIGNAVPAKAGLRSTIWAQAGATDRPEIAAASSAAVQTRPYKFLDYYTEHDSALFFGREREIELIASQIFSRRSFILHGRSGVGKSSLLRAGLLPRLRADGHLVLIIRGFGDPLQEMAEAIDDSADSGGDDESKLLAGASAASCGMPGRLVVFVLDQFEEFFSLATEQTRARFMRAAGRLADASGSATRLVFALREDVLSEMSLLKPAIPDIFHNEYRLERLDRGQAVRAIVEPARTVGCDYESGLVDRLINDLADDRGIDPPQLQIVCDSLYDAREPGGRVTLESYESLGSASRILGGYLERVMRRFRAEDLRAARSLLTALISESGERVIVPEVELRVRSTGGLIAPETARYLLEELVASRIVRRRNHHGEAWVELAHDFLTAGISKWVTEKDIALKRARAVIERAVENFRAHALMIDSETLELVLPFADQLSPTPAEADLLLASCLSRRHRVPEWLTPAAPDATARITEAVRSTDPKVRVCGVEAAGHIGGDNLFGLMRRAALWDPDLAVRKAASINLAHRMNTDAQAFLSEPSPDGKPGPVRRAVSIAMIRDYDRRLVRLPDLSRAVAALVVLGLIWVRLRRDSTDIIRKSTGGLMGAAASGLFGGSALGLALALARKAAPVEAIGLILVLGSLGFFIGLLGGGGVSFGMITAEHIAYRHSRWWSVVGAATGGAFIGASSNLLGVDVVRALFGQNPAGITGGLEGAAIGAGLSLGFVLGPSWFKRHVRAARVLGASLGSMLAGVLLALVGGNLFSASLEIVARMFSNSQIRMDVLAELFGQVSFGSKVQIVLGALEGLLFGAGVALGITANSRADHPSTSRLREYQERTQ